MGYQPFPGNPEVWKGRTWGEAWVTVSPSARQRELGMWAPRTETVRLSRFQLLPPEMVDWHLVP